MGKRSLGVFIALCASAPAFAFELPLSANSTRLDFTPGQPFSIAPGVELVVRGSVRAQGPVRAVMRIDDGKSVDYATRVNDERILPPGPFVWRLLPSGARMIGGGVINAQDIRRISLFMASAGAEIAIESASLRDPAALPVGAKGYSYGLNEAQVFPGFERVAPKDKRIEAGLSQPIRRPGVDALIGNGLRGVERTRLPWPQGRARVSLWTEDVGEWEALPHSLERRVRVNGIDLRYERFTPAQWIAQRYLSGRDRELGADHDSWNAYGSKRGGLITGEVDVGANGILIEFAGESANSAYLSAVLIEPAGQRIALDDVQARRAEAYRSLWRVAQTRATTALPEIEVAANGAKVSPPLRIVLGRGTGARIAFNLASPLRVEQPRIHIEAPVLANTALPVDLWAAQRRLERRSVGLNLLTPTQDLLRGDPSSLPIEPGNPRTYQGWTSAPADTAPGLYAGRIEIATSAGRTFVPLEVEVLNAAPPPAVRQAGFYLDEAPHLTWFPGSGGLRRTQVACDLAFLQRMGVNGNAPALATPAGGSEDSFIVDSLNALAAENASPWLAYAPAKRVRSALGLQGSAQKLAQVSAFLRQAGLQPPVWSVADEPSNADHSEGDLEGWVRALRAADPQAKLAAQLNNRADARLLDLFDVVLVNAGFGLDVRDIARAAKGGRDVWLYNTDAPRFTPAIWLNAVGASRYVQWHARMPTADPFDPTDGREGDVQMLYPTLEPCPARHDIHPDVLSMAEGLVDQRWISWLESSGEPEAQRLFESLSAGVPEYWREGLSRMSGRLDELRTAIQNLARSLN